MSRNKKFLIGFLTCASLVLIMAHDYNNNHKHREYADNRHSHGSGYNSYAEENHRHDSGDNAYAPIDHSHPSGADWDHKHDDLEWLMKEASYNLSHIDKLNNLLNQISGFDKEFSNILTINKLKQRIENLEYELLHHKHSRIKSSTKLPTRDKGRDGDMMIVNGQLLIKDGDFWIRFNSNNETENLK